jgi:hypothetical protein
VTEPSKTLSRADQAYAAFVEAAWQRHLRLALLLTFSTSHRDGLPANAKGRGQLITRGDAAGRP